MSRFPGPSWTSTHQYGQGNKLVSKKLVYYNIPKCASMWMRSYVSDIGRVTEDPWSATVFTEEPLDDYAKIIILRDPVARWLSICPAQVTVPNLEPDSPDSDRFFRNIHTFLADEHVAPQIDFIKGLDLSQVFWFKTGPDLSSLMHHFVRTHIGADVPPPEPVNESPADSAWQHGVQCWQQLLTVPKYLAQLQELYQEDYKLIESVDFYAG